jgi:hypothetical protein
LRQRHGAREQQENERQYKPDHETSSSSVSVKTRRYISPRLNPVQEKERPKTRNWDLRKLFTCAAAIGKTHKDADDIRAHFRRMIGPEKIP